MKKMLSLGAILVSLCVLFSCSKDVQPTPDHDTDPGPEPVHEVTTTIQGRVYAMTFSNLPNQPVAGALVKCGGKTVVTDKLGAFILKDVKVDKDGAVITVLKDGQFDITRTVMITDEEQIQNVRIDLTIAYDFSEASFNAATGGVVDLYDDQYTFLPNQLLKEDNSVYTGQAHLRMWYFADDNNITSSESYSASPGNLRGINKNGNEVLLQPFVNEILDVVGAAGERLHLDTSGGKAVAFTKTVRLTGPQTIPVWCFNTGLARWEEYGIATRTGDTYSGKMKSPYLAFATEFPATTLTATFQDTTTGMPWANKLVKIKGNNGHNAKAYTDVKGQVRLLVPANEAFTLELMDDRYFDVLLSLTVDAMAAAKDLGLIHLKAVDNRLFIVSGTVDGCDWALPKNAVVNVLVDGLRYQFPVVDGRYKATIWKYTYYGTSSYQLFASDHDNPDKEPLTLSVTDPFGYYDPWPHKLTRNLNSCGVLPGQFISYTLKGKPFSSVFPQDSTSMHNIDTAWYIDGFPKDYYSGAELSVYLPLNLAPGTYTSHASFWEFSTRASYSGEVRCTINKSGKPGEYINGTFSGTMKNDVPPYDTTTITGYYRYLIPQ